MAIALDIGVYRSFTTATSQTFSHTVAASPADPFLLVMVQADNSSDVITGITYAGAAMSLVGTGKVQRALNRWCYMYYKAAPATGANNVVVSASSSVFIQSHSVSYTGVDQSAPIDGSSINNTASATSLTMTVSVTGANCWLASFGQVDSGGGQGPVNVGTGATRRSNDTDFGSTATFDSAATVGTGSQTIQHTWSGVGGGVGLACSILPSGGAGGGVVIPVFMNQYRQRGA